MIVETKCAPAYSGRLNIEVRSCKIKNMSRQFADFGVDQERHTQSKRELYPTSDEYPIEVAVCDDDDIARDSPLFQVLAVVGFDLCYDITDIVRGCKGQYTHLLDDIIDTVAHVRCALSAGTAILPDGPSRVLLLDLMGFESFVIAIVPFSHFLSDNVVRLLLNVVEEKMKGAMSTSSR